MRGVMGHCWNHPCIKGALFLQSNLLPKRVKVLRIRCPLLEGQCMFHIMRPLFLSRVVAVLRTESHLFEATSTVVSFNSFKVLPNGLVLNLYPQSSHLLFLPSDGSYSIHKSSSIATYISDVVGWGMRSSNGYPNGRWYTPPRARRRSTRRL
jgi:hypothetical protein